MIKLCLRIGPRCDAVCANITRHDSSEGRFRWTELMVYVVAWVSEMRYLGVYRLRLKTCPEKNCNFSQLLRYLTMKFSTIILKGCSVLLLHILRNSVNDKVWNTKCNFCKSPASDAQHLLHSAPKQKLNFCQKKQAILQKISDYLTH